MAHGDITHLDIPADDIARARQFYGTVFGWDIQEYPGFEGYPMWQGPNKVSGGGIAPRVGGLVHPRSYVEVDSIDDALAGDRGQRRQDAHREDAHHRHQLVRRLRGHGGQSAWAVRGHHVDRLRPRTSRPAQGSAPTFRTRSPEAGQRSPDLIPVVGVAWSAPSQRRRPSQGRRPSQSALVAGSARVAGRNGPPGAQISHRLGRALHPEPASSTTNAMTTHSRPSALTSTELVAWSIARPAPTRPIRAERPAPGGRPSPAPRVVGARAPASRPRTTPRSGAGSRRGREGRAGRPRCLDPVEPEGAPVRAIEVVADEIPAAAGWHHPKRLDQPIRRDPRMRLCGETGPAGCHDRPAPGRSAPLRRPIRWHRGPRMDAARRRHCAPASTLRRNDFGITCTALASADRRFGHAGIPLCAPAARPRAPPPRRHRRQRWQRRAGASW